MTNLLRKGLLGLAACTLWAAPASAGSFGLIPYSWYCCGGCKCGCVVRPYNAFTPAMCSNPACIDNAFPNPNGCYDGACGQALASGLPPWMGAQGYAGLQSAMPVAQAPMLGWGMAYQPLPQGGYTGYNPGVGYNQGYAGYNPMWNYGVQMGAPNTQMAQPVVGYAQPMPVGPAMLNR